MGHIHDVTDNDRHFTIDAVTRKVEQETPKKHELVRFDHNSKRYTFEIPKYVDGHDMSLCSNVRIHYVNSSSDKRYESKDVYEVDDLSPLSDKNDTMVFTWLVSRTATKFVGPLSFTIAFMCTTGDIIDYVWNTKVCSVISVSEGFDNTELVLDDYSDTLSKFKNDLRSYIDTELGVIMDATY